MPAFLRVLLEAPSPTETRRKGCLFESNSTRQTVKIKKRDAIFLKMPAFLRVLLEAPSPTAKLDKSSGL